MAHALPLGVMQGRLVPKYQGRYQAHPKGYWQDEFPVAADLSLDLIEFILDFEDAQRNPLLCDVNAIRSIIDETGVGVRSICADYFMVAPIHTASESIDLLNTLIATADDLGIADIVIPCVDGSSIRTKGEMAAFVAAVGTSAVLAAKAGVNLALETDLAPGPFIDLLDAIGSDAVTVNYDTGNSAALGFAPREEFDAYGARISDIHIKDRPRGGGPVVLGDGDCDFGTVFELIDQYGYDGPLIMQAYRDDEGVAIFRHQRDWLADRFPEFVQPAASPDG